MTNPICEEWQSRPSSTAPGWNQWGPVDDLGQFTPEYGLEAKLNFAESMYYLAAAGKCEIKGQYRQGEATPIDTPKPEVDDTVTDGGAVDAVPPSDVSQAGAAVQTIDAAPLAESQHWLESVPAWGYGLIIGAAVFALVIAAFYQSRQTKATDTTPAPQYKINPFGGDD